MDIQDIVEKESVREAGDEAARAKLRADILKLNKQLPTRWKHADGSESWRNSNIESWLDKHPDDMVEIRDSLLATLAYLKANPKAILPDPFAPKRFPRKQAGALKAIGQRLGREFTRWLAENDDDAAAVMKSKVELLNAIDTYLRDEKDITVRPDGLVEFWGLTPEKQRLIGDLPVALFHYTSSRVVPSIRRDGLTADNKPINGTRYRAVYLTTETSGPPVEGYKRNAVAAHGGHPVMLTVRCRLGDLQPDPDDDDITSGRHQFIVPYVAPEDIVGQDRA